MNIPNEAIEAAAQALEQYRPGELLPIDELARVAVGAAEPLIAAQVLPREIIAVLYDFWHYFHHEAGGYDASSIGLVTAYDVDDAFELSRLSDLIEPHESAIREALAGSTPDPDYEGHPR